MTMAETRDGLMTIDEAAEFLSLSRRTIYVLLDNDKLPSVRFGRGQRIPRRAVIDLARRGDSLEKK